MLNLTHTAFTFTTRQLLFWECNTVLSDFTVVSKTTTN